MNLKLLLFVIAIIISLTLFSACGGATPEYTPVPSPSSPAAPPVPTSEPAPAAEPTIPTPPKGIAMATPHELAGRDNCLTCHETGIHGASAIPADHAGRTNDLCSTCHKPSAG